MAQETGTAIAVAEYGRTGRAGIASIRDDMVWLVTIIFLTWTEPYTVKLRISTLSELPGYVLFGNNDLRYQLLCRGGMSVKVPGNVGRDLYGICFASVNHATTLTLGSSVYAPA